MPIFDQGYQHWSGELAGHTWRWLAITRHGLRIALAGRTIRFVLIAALLPALVLAFALVMWGLLEQQSELITGILPMFGFIDPAILAGPRAYRVEIWTLAYNFFLSAELGFAMVLVLLAGPNLISQDLRYNALPLYLSRPLRRIDYFLGKLGVIVALLCGVIVVPSIVAYLLGIAFSLDLSVLRDTFRILLASIGYGLVVSFSTGLLILALSSLSRSSRYVALFWIGIWFVTSAVSGALETAHRHEQFVDANVAAMQGNVAGILSIENPEEPRDWRPIVSYTANLWRVGQEMLGTEAAWVKLSRLQPAQHRRMFLLTMMGPPFPWVWSAAVLAALAGLSICILNLRIKSLDQLR